MTDAAFVVAAYAVVLGGLVLYGLTLARRGRAMRLRADAIDRQRRSDASVPKREPPITTPVPAPESR